MRGFYETAEVFNCGDNSARVAGIYASGGKNDANQRGGKGAEHMSSKGSFNTNSQWSADPDKGWVRADERHKQHDKDHPRDDVRPKIGKAKGKPHKS